MKSCCGISSTHLSSNLTAALRLPLKVLAERIYKILFNGKHGLNTQCMSKSKLLTLLECVEICSGYVFVKNWLKSRSVEQLIMSVFVLDRHLQAKKSLQRPEKLVAVFQTVNGSLEGLFSWQVSEATPGQTPITGFQFSRVKVSSSRVNKSSDSLISQTLNLPPVSWKAFVRHNVQNFLLVQSWRMFIHNI